MVKEEQPIEDQNHQRQRQKAENEALQTLTLGQNPNEDFNTRLMSEFTNMGGSVQERIKRLFNRLQKFFLRDKSAKINIKDGYFCKKREPFYGLRGVHVVDNQIIIFGVDFAKHREIIKAYQPDDFCQIDMSHVKLIYSDFYSAMQALTRNQRQMVEENILKIEKDVKQPPKGWMEMKPYYISNYERRVLARFATSEELEVKNSHKLQSNIPLFAKKVYELKKKESEDIMENCRLREQKLERRKFEKKQMSSFGDRDHENYNRVNEIVDNKSDISYSLNIGKGRNGGISKQDDKSSVSQRERSREKDFDNQSVCSKRSSLSSLAGNMANKMKLDEKSDKESIVSDASFILAHKDQNQELFQDMAMRIGLIHMNDQGNNNTGDRSFELPENLQNSFVSSASSRSYRLSQNMPDKKDDQSFTKKPWKYSQYNQQTQRQAQRKIKQEKEVVIVIESDDNGEIEQNKL